MRILGGQTALISAVRPPPQIFGGGAEVHKFQKHLMIRDGRPFSQLMKIIEKSLQKRFIIKIYAKKPSSEKKPHQKSFLPREISLRKRVPAYTGFQWEIRKNRTMAFLEYTTKTKVIGDDERRRLTPKFSGESNGDVIFPKFSILEVEKLNFKCFFYVFFTKFHFFRLFSIKI